MTTPVRDLACPDLWERSLERSRRRRQAARDRRPQVAGPAAAALITATLAGTTVQAAEAHKTTGRAASSLLRAGSTGELVSAAQRALGVAVTGRYDRRTVRAVRSFQRKRGLAVDGVIGPRTAAALGLEARSTSTRTVSLRLDRDTVRALQRAVGVRADGAIGPRTRAAIRRAERRNGLRADGRPDAELLRLLGVSADEEAAKPRNFVAPAAGQGAAAAVEAARSKVGASYASGGNGPSSFDCSGLTVYAFEQAGVALPRTSFDQYGQGTRVAKSEIQAGDLVFFDTNGPGASHVAIATSPTTAISATTRGVREHSITDSYWSGHYVGARRVA